MIVLDRVLPEDVERVWPHLEAHIKAACNAVTTELTPEFIKEEALADRRTLWAILDTEQPFPFLAVWVTGQRQTNKGMVLFIEACGGRQMHRWLPGCLDELEAQAKAIGVNRIEIEGRRAWKRVLPGYREARIVLEKDI